MTAPDVVLLRFGDARVPCRAPSSPMPGPLVEVAGAPDVDAWLDARRLVVLGGPADVALVLSRLLRADRLDVEVAAGARRADPARPTRRVPLIRDETGAVLVGHALWLPPAGAAALTGEAVVDDAVLFDGAVAGVRVEPTDRLPGLRARVLAGPLARRRWVSGRAAQLGAAGVTVVRDGVPATRPARRSTFYRHTTGWLAVR